ncbi:hypothetical protein ACWGK7_04860 [Sphingomonas aurantiaca]
MRDLMNIVSRFAETEREILSVMRLGEYFRAEGAVIADTRNTAVRYFIPVDAPAPSEADVAEVDRLEANGETDDIIQYLLKIGVLKKI